MILTNYFDSSKEPEAKGKPRCIVFLKELSLMDMANIFINTYWVEDKYACSLQKNSVMKIF